MVAGAEPHNKFCKIHNGILLLAPAYRISKCIELKFFYEACKYYRVKLAYTPPPEESQNCSSYQKKVSKGYEDDIEAKDDLGLKTNLDIG